jgi:broad specificity phosphatase PhoE
MSVSNLKSGVEFVLVRHGESVSNLEIHSGKENLTLFHDAELTDIGREQAKVTCEYLSSKLKDRKVLKIYTSPQQRAIDTGSDLTKEYPCISEIFLDIYEYRAPPKEDLVFSGGICRTDTTWKDFCARVQRFVDVCENLAKDLETKEKPVIVIFGHSLFFSTFITMCASQKRYLPYDGESISFHLPNTCLSNLFFNGDRWSILSVGAVHHLSNELSIRHTNI